MGSLPNGKLRAGFFRLQFVQQAKAGVEFRRAQNLSLPRPSRRRSRSKRQHE